MEPIRSNFKDCLSRLASGVTIVTTEDKEGRLHGVTISSFTSLSLEPPLVLFCLSKLSTNFQAFSNAVHFTISFLSESQQALSHCFASHDENKWQHTKWNRGKFSNCPVINGCIAYIECDKSHSYDGGDHVINIGKVINVEVLSEENPLIHYRRDYHRLSKPTNKSS